jgi:acetyl-CoA carboxylase biotin carboxyl carrier protein
MNYTELQDFIKAVAKSGATEVKIDSEDLKITIKAPGKGKTTETIVQQIPVAAQMPQAMPMAAPAPAPAPAAPVSAPAPEAKEEDNSNLITIKAPMVGTFYRKSAPEKPAFVNVDDTIEPGKVICILEAMKLFNEIEAEVSGKIVKVLVDDATPVEYDQPLFLVDPS